MMEPEGMQLVEFHTLVDGSILDVYLVLYMHINTSFYETCLRGHKPLNNIGRGRQWVVLQLVRIY